MSNFDTDRAKDLADAIHQAVFEIETITAFQVYEKIGRLFKKGHQDATSWYSIEHKSKPGETISDYPNEYALVEVPLNTPGTLFWKDLYENLRDFKALNDRNGTEGFYRSVLEHFKDNVIVRHVEVLETRPENDNLVWTGNLCDKFNTSF